ncbi:hypothetical protein GOBAR_DD17543 [Gossypium barbadense]|nr:hypothetical protein GOBAR_DD17543 [Gossypium barbadense]
MEFSEKVLSGSSWGASCFLKHLVEYAVPQLLICRLTDPQAVEFAKGRHLCFLLKSLALILTMLLHSGTGLVVITVAVCFEQPTKTPKKALVYEMGTKAAEY